MAIWLLCCREGCVIQFESFILIINRSDLLNLLPVKVFYYQEKIENKSELLETLSDGCNYQDYTSLDHKQARF